MINVSIITPTFNRGALLPRVWQSLKEQRCDFEWIIADDGSNDNTALVIESLGDSRITYIALPENRGANAARNAGVKTAKGRYIVFLDSDDELYPDSLPVMIEVMNNAEAEIGAAAFACIMADTGRQISALNDGDVIREYDVVCGTAFQNGDKILVYRREVFDEFLLTEEVRGCEFVFVYEVSKKWAYLLKNKPLSIVHRQLDNMSNSDSMVARSYDMARSFEMVLDNHAQILKIHPKARFRFLLKALYRYLVAGARAEAWRVYKSILRQQHSLKEFTVATLMLLSGRGILSSFEKWRIDRINRTLTSC